MYILCSLCLLIGVIRDYQIQLIEDSWEIKMQAYLSLSLFEEIINLRSCQR